MSDFKTDLMRKFYLLFVILFVAVACYGQVPNTWVQKNYISWNNPYGAGRSGAVGFSIGTKGYIGGGGGGLGFWEWDQSTNVWTQKADGGSGFGGTGFSIG